MRNFSFLIMIGYYILLTTCMLQDSRGILIYNKVEQIFNLHLLWWSPMCPFNHNFITHVYNFSEVKIYIILAEHPFSRIKEASLKCQGSDASENNNFHVWFDRSNDIFLSKQVQLGRGQTASLLAGFLEAILSCFLKTIRRKKL